VDGVSNLPPRPPTAPVTQRAHNRRLLNDFRAWASSEAPAATTHTQQLTTAQLTDTDYDVELTATYTPATQQQAVELARSFSEWWDGDHGEDGIARNVLVLANDGSRLAAARL
jgi:hypothetical protein